MEALDDRSLEGLAERVEAEYRELPGLSLTEPQAERLFGLDGSTCRYVLDWLQRERVLRRTAEGRYIRLGI